MAPDADEENNRPERYINRFVILQTVVLMAIRGLGVLALAWSTVVLLGGFVTLLGKKDFWCITVLSLLQTARIFNALADEQYRYFVELLFDTNKRRTATKTQQRLENSNEMARLCPNDEKKELFQLSSSCPSYSKKVLGYKLTFLLLLFPLIIVVCHPVLVVLLSISVSSYRLNQEDYGRGTANLIPAMVIFYSLALAQGVFYFFWLVLTILESQMVKLVSDECEFEYRWGYSYVSRYLRETRSKCLKDLSSIRERNLITHASDLMDSDYKDDYISGARILVTFIEKQKLPVNARIGFSRSTIQKLISILARTDVYDSEIRLLAAKIVEHIAGDISVAQFPGTLDCLSSLLKVSEENPIFTSRVENIRNSPMRNDMEGGISNNKNNSIAENVIHSPECQLIMDEDLSQTKECKLIIKGFLILEKLCSNDHNCIHICKAQLLITHILAWVFSRPFLRQYEKDHWVTILTLSLRVLARLGSIRGEPAQQVRNKIVFELYPSCISGYATHPEVHSKAIYTFSHAYTRNKFSGEETQKRDGFITILLRLFSFEKIKQEKPNELIQAEEAGKALSRLCIYRNNCRAIINIKGHIVSELSKMIDSCEKIVHRAIAANLLMRIISHSKGEKPNEVLKGLGNEPGKRLQKILQQLFSICEEEKQGNNIGKGQHVPGYVRANTLSDAPHDLKKLQATLVRVIYIMLSTKQIARLQFVRAVGEWESTSKHGNKVSFLQFLRMLVDKNIWIREPNPLDIIKWVARLVELMLKRGAVEKQSIIDVGIMNSLEKASTTMPNVDSWILYLGTHNRGAVSATSLSSLVNSIWTYLPKQGRDHPCTIADEFEGEEILDEP